MKGSWIVVAAAVGLSLPAVAQEQVGREICAGCHDEADGFAAGPHGRLMDEATLERSCEGCHGPGAEHVEEPSPETIRRWPGDEACLSCHGGMAARLSLLTPGHGRHAVACLDCHQPGHEATPTDYLLAAAPAALCGDCHGEQAAQARLPFAHREGSREFACTNCHSAHAGPRVGRLALEGPGGACLDCHVDQAGPHVFPHPSRAASGCVECHQPHGSPNPRLLTRPTMLSLCLECHTGVPAFHDVTRSRFRACQTCHSAVHGSDRDPRLFEE